MISRFVWDCDCPSSVPSALDPHHGAVMTGTGPLLKSDSSVPREQES